MDDSERNEKLLQRKANKLVKQMRVAEERAKKSGLRIYVTIGPKGGLGKTLLARLLIDKHRAAREAVRIVQIDRTPQLPGLYGDEVSVVRLPGAEELRADPLAAVVAMEPYTAAIDSSLRDGAALIVDVGGGPSASGMVEYTGKARVDNYLMQQGVRSTVFLLLLPDPAAMAQSIELGSALEVAYPSAEIVVVLNERDGKFRFFAGSAAERVWRETVAPFTFGRQTLRMPALPAGAMPPFETLGFTFTDIINTDETSIAQRLGMSRAIAATLQGDVAAWLESMWAALDDVMNDRQGGADA